MIHLEHQEALLLRMLSSFFGQDHVIPKMSLFAVCGGVVKAEDIDRARKTPCLFTVVDTDDQPKIVFDFFSGFDKPFEVKDVEGQQFAKPMLESHGIRYITMTAEEFAEITDPQSPLDFYHWLKDKMDL
jgi:hypothetical protein